MNLYIFTARREQEVMMVLQKGSRGQGKSKQSKEIIPQVADQHLSGLAPISLPSTASSLLRRLGIHFLDHLREGGHNLLACRKAALHSLHKVPVHSLRLSALLFSLLWCDLEARGGGLIAMPRERVGARKEVSTVLAEYDIEGVRLRRLAVALKLTPIPVPTVRTESTLDLVDGPARQVGLRGRKQ